MFPIFYVPVTLSSRSSIFPELCALVALRSRSSVFPLLRTLTLSSNIATAPPPAKTKQTNKQTNKKHQIFVFIGILAGGLHFDYLPSRLARLPINGTADAELLCVLPVCECRRSLHVSVAVPALTLDADACHRILNRRPVCDGPYRRRLCCLQVLDVKENHLLLYKYMFPPDLQHPTLAVIGYIQADGPVWPIPELQSRLATQSLQGEAAVN